MTEEIEIPLASTDKYEEALAKARFEYEKNPCASESEKRLLEIIFPELAESEDERIRRFLVELVSNDKLIDFGGLYKARNVLYDDVLTYLEKQKGVEAEIEKAYKNADKIQYEKGFEDGVASVKSYMKLKEHDMPSSTELIAKWNEEKKILQEKYEPGHPWRLAYNAFMDGFGYGFHVKQKEQKPAEIDEYEIIKKHITEDSLSSEVNKRLKECGWYVTDEKPAEWSEEDEKMKQRILTHLYSFIYPNSLYGEDASECISWLKSLRPQFHWKPSEIDMKYLDLAIVLAEADKSDNLADGLKRLKGNLKKL